MLKLLSFLFKAFGILLLAGMVIGVGLIMYGTRQYNAFHDPEHVPDIAHYVAHYGIPESIYLKRVNGVEYYGLVAPRGNFETLVSGPPVFLYDRQGKLWDYNLNSGDAPFTKSGFLSDRFDGQVEDVNQTIQKLMKGTSEADMKSLNEIIYIDDGQLCSTTDDAEIKSRCVESSSGYGFPAWSPSGDAIAVESKGTDGVNALMLLKKDGEPLKKIKDSAEFIRPVWSPDGNHIYAVNQKIGAAVGRWEKSGGDFQLIPIHGIPGNGSLGAFEFIERISFSPDGNSLAILAEGFNRILIAKNKNGSFHFTRQVPEEGLASVGMTAWFDDSRLLFIGHRDPRRAELFELNIANGSIEQKSIPGLLISEGLALSPDKKSVVISGVSETDKTDIRWNLWSYSFDSAKLVKLSSGSEDTNPSWRGSGRRR